MNNEKANMAQRYEREIPEGYEARIEGNKVIIEPNESEDERIRKELLALVRMNVLPEATCLVRGGSVTRAQAEAYLEKQKELAVIPDELVKNYKLFCEQGGRELALLINAINGFNKQKEQKSEEWSEEDERIYQSIMDDTVQENQLDEKQINWLRDIKYRNFVRPKIIWKPSEEQMKALNEVANDGVLLDLFNDLQKLL